MNLGSPATLVTEQWDGEPFYEGHDLSKANMPKVWAVGATPKAAIEALCEARWNGKLESELTPLPTDPERSDPKYTWGYRFLSDNGTSFKAAGIHIPGGVLLTWWK